MLNRQVEVKHDRELKRKMEDLKQEKYIVANEESQQRTMVGIDYLPHEWNDPGLRYLRKSMSSTAKLKSIEQNYANRAGVLNRSLDQDMLAYSSGKKTMLEPLQNYESRKNFK